jgi:hypothetical protein
MDLWRVPSDGTRKPQRLVGAGERGEDPAVAPEGGRMGALARFGRSAQYMCSPEASLGKSPRKAFLIQLAEAAA